MYNPRVIRSRWAMAGLLLATLAAYLPALRAGFIWDDDHYVTGNRTLTAPDALRRIWTEPGATPQYYPLVFTTFWAEHRLWGLDPAGYHAVNVLLHAMNAVLVALLLKRLPMPGAWLAGLLFALHPVHVESVAWITERKNVLSGLFYLLALGAFWTWEEKGSRWRYGGALALFALALLAKSVTASLPCALFLLRWVRGRPLDRRFLASLLPFLLLGAAMGLNTAHLERAHVRAVGPEWELSLLQRLSIAGRALPFYLGKLAWPSGLVFVQYPREVPPPGISLPLLWPLGVLAGGAALWLARGRTGRALQAAAAFFAVTLFPALGFVNIYPMRYSFVADHYQYLASLGPIALAAAAACRLPRVVLAPPLPALGILPFRQSRVYETPQTLWEDVLSKNPRAWMAHDCLGQILANRKRDADIDGAIAHYQASL